MLVATLRQLVQAVIVHAPPGTDELAIEIKASLSELTLPGPLLKRSSGGTNGSGGATVQRPFPDVFAGAENGFVPPEFCVVPARGTKHCRLA